MLLRRLFFIAAMLGAGAPQAQDFPTRPVRIVVGFQAGGGTDIAARVIAQKLTDALGVTFIVDNRPGASFIIGFELMAKATPDGYTIGYASFPIATNPSMFAKILVGNCWILVFRSRTCGTITL